MEQPSKAKPRVVILGAGFGGMEAAKALRHAPVELIIVDRQNHHCFQPLLYQVATASLSPADVAWPIRSILSRQANARVIMAEVNAIDVYSATVLTDVTPPISLTCSYWRPAPRTPILGTRNGQMSRPA